MASSTSIPISTRRTRGVLHASAVVAVSILAVRLLFAAKEVVLARVFGRSDALEAFLLASLLPTFLVPLLSESMNQALLPRLAAVRRERGQQAARAMASGALSATAGILLATSLLLACVARPFATQAFSGFPPAKLELALRLFYCLLPVGVLSGVASTAAAVLNSSGRFAWPALVRAFSPLLMIAAALTAASSTGVFGLALAMLTGVAAEAALLLWSIRRAGYGWWGVRGAISDARQLAAPYGVMLLSGLLSTGVNLADQSMTATLAAGSLAALAYGSKCTSFVLNVAGMTIATTFVPFYSEMVARRDWRECQRTVTRALSLCLLAAVPLTFVLIAASPWVVRVLFQHGAFTAADTSAVVMVQRMYAIQIPFFLAGRILQRLLVAMQHNRLVMLGNALNLALDIVLNLLLMRTMGVAGIALATSIYAIASALFMAFWVHRLLGRQLAESSA